MREQHEHFIKFEDGYTSVVCKAPKESICHARFKCDCIDYYNIDIEDNELVHYAGDDKHVGWFDTDSCHHKDWVAEDDECIHGSIVFPVEPEWHGDYYTYNIAVEEGTV